MRSFRQGRSLTTMLLVATAALLAPTAASATPTASFTYTPASPQVGQPVQFTDTSTDDSSSIEDYEWTVDGDQASQSAGLSYTFDSPGSHQVTLTVWNADGDQGTTTQTVTVADPPPPPAPFPGQVVLGSSDFVANGSGWGRPHPRTIFNGGVPSGLVNNIRWQHWGAPVATGTGRNPIYMPQGGYYPHPARVRLIARDVGQCPGESQTAYLTLLIRIPQWPGGPLGPWFRWSDARTLCDYAERAHSSTARLPGFCGDIGDHGFSAGDSFSIVAYKVRCSTARRVARTMKRRLRHEPARCVRRGCTRGARGFRCRADRVRSSEQSPGLDYHYPVQRIACRHGAGNITWWLVLNWD